MTPEDFRPEGYESPWQVSLSGLLWMLVVVAGLLIAGGAWVLHVVYQSTESRRRWRPMRERRGRRSRNSKGPRERRKAPADEGRAPTPRRVRVPRDAVAANVEKQCYGIGGPLAYYRDRRRTCVECGDEFVFSALEQKHERRFIEVAAGVAGCRTLVQRARSLA